MNLLRGCVGKLYILLANALPYAFLMRNICLYLKCGATVWRWALPSLAGMGARPIPRAATLSTTRTMSILPVPGLMRRTSLPPFLRARTHLGRKCSRLGTLPHILTVR